MLSVNFGSEFPFRIVYSLTDTMPNIFKKGLILGGILAVAAAVGFALSDKGQELTEEVQKDLKTLAKKLKKRLSTLEDITEDSFNELVATVVDEFAKQHDLLDDVKSTLSKSLKSMWKEMEALAIAEKEDSAA